MRRRMILVLLAALLVSVFGTAHAQLAQEEPTGEGIIFDMVILRPAGAVVLVGGTALFIVSYPLALITKSEKTTAKKLVVEPYEFTFGRPLGEDRQGKPY